MRCWLSIGEGEKIKGVLWCIGRRYEIMWYENSKIRKKYFEAKQIFWELHIFLRSKFVNVSLILFTAHELPPSEFSFPSQLMTEELSMSLPFSVVSVCLGVPFLHSYSTVALILLLCLVNSCLVRPLPLLMRILPFLYVNFLIVWATPAHPNMISSSLFFLHCIFFCILCWGTPAKAEVLKSFFTLFIHWQSLLRQKGQPNNKGLPAPRLKHETV